MEEELLWVTEKWKKKYQKDLARLDIELAPSRDKIAELESQLKEKEEEIEKQRVTITDFKKEMKMAEVALVEERDKCRDAKKAAQDGRKGICC